MKLRKAYQVMDRISALPQDTIENILTLMPARDAVRTSILSRRWRYCWTSMPRLDICVSDFDVSSNSEEFNKHKIVKDICLVLLLHVGPILEFSIDITCYPEIADEIDPIILHLLRSNSIKKFYFWIEPAYCCYKLPISFYSLQGLEHLHLMGCIINPPLIFNGFSMLRSLCFYHCMITIEMLLPFLTNCGLLEEFSLVLLDVVDCLWVKISTFVELFNCLSSVQVLKMCTLWMEDFAGNGMPQKLPTPLVHLRVLVYDVCFVRYDEISSLFCVINSSPNLEKIKLMMRGYRDGYRELDYENLFDLEDHSDLNLDHLKELEITWFNNVAHEMEFVKLIMAKSPVLKLARLKLSPSVTADEEFKMFKDLVRQPFPRASPTANLIIERMA